MRTVDRIQSILDEKGISAAKMMRDLGFSSGLFSQWKAGKQKPSLDKLDKIADYLDADVEYLRRDELKEKSIEKFGFCWEQAECERLKGDARGAISEGNLSPEQLVENAVIIFKALFSRSLRAYNFSPKHVDFQTYVAMLLNQGERQRLIFGDLSDEEYQKLYNILVDKFGKKEGIPSGTYYPYERYHFIENNQKAERKSNDVTNEVKLIARKTKDLPEEDREALLDLLNNTVDTFLKAKGIKND